MPEQRGMLRTLEPSPYERWAQLIQQRNQAPPEQQAILGPREHGAYTEYKVAENPLNAALMLPLIPGYTAAKALGLAGGRSPASLEELAEAYKGMWRGLGIDWK